MRFLRQNRGTQAELKSAPFGSVFVSPAGHNTKIADAHFEITLPGVWEQSQRDTRTTFNDSTGKLQLFLNQFQIEGALRAGMLRVLLADQVAHKQAQMTDFAKGNTRFSTIDARKTGGQEELRFHGLDLMSKVACFTVFRATAAVAIDFSLYQFGVEEIDANFKSEMDKVFDSIRLK